MTAKLCSKWNGRQAKHPNWLSMGFLLVCHWQISINSFTSHSMKRDPPALQEHTRWPLQLPIDWLYESANNSKLWCFQIINQIHLIPPKLMCYILITDEHNSIMGSINTNCLLSHLHSILSIHTMLFRIVTCSSYAFGSGHLSQVQKLEKYPQICFFF